MLPRARPIQVSGPRRLRLTDQASHGRPEHLGHLCRKQGSATKADGGVLARLQRMDKETFAPSNRHARTWNAMFSLARGMGAQGRGRGVRAYPVTSTYGARAARARGARPGGGPAAARRLALCGIPPGERPGELMLSVLVAHGLVAAEHLRMGRRRGRRLEPAPRT